MIVQVTPDLLTTVSYLPSTGEITYDAWKQALSNDGKSSLIFLTRQAKQAKLVNYRLQNNEDGSQTLMVSRAK